MNVSKKGKYGEYHAQKQNIDEHLGKIHLINHPKHLYVHLEFLSSSNVGNPPKFAQKKRFMFAEFLPLLAFFACRYCGTKAHDAGLQPVRMKEAMKNKDDPKKNKS